ncbi:hypothetical protein [Streptomyces sp. NPDC007083]|uniref:hypothetical protein n=1 Tax=unclassified Streptomyces TaxID=2593676 RepID=UPI0033C53C56
MGKPRSVESGAKNSFSELIKTRDWSTWMARAAAMARHHIFATPSVAGWAWQASARGAPTVSSAMALTRNM